MRDIYAYTASNDIESDQHVDSNVRPYGKTFGKLFVPLVEPYHITVNVLFLDKSLNEIIDGKYVTSDS